MRYWNLHIIHRPTEVLFWYINTYMRRELMSKEIKINPSFGKSAWCAAEDIDVEFACRGDVFYFEGVESTL